MQQNTYYLRRAKATQQQNAILHRQQGTFIMTESNNPLYPFFISVQDLDEH